tara:strand:- start:260 stop:421 length:162 start_codon:yes stop_codon:yes gene_type:complete
LLQVIFNPPPIFVVAKMGVVSNGLELGRYAAKSSFDLVDPEERISFNKAEQRR